MHCTKRFSAATLLLVALTTSASAAGWKGAKILPKSDSLMLQSSTGTVGTIYDIAWPATVEDTSGRWLLVRDEGGFADRPIAGWVYADDVIKLDEAREFYTDLASERPEAWVYWLRGVYWESQRELGIAFLDYQQAAKLDTDNRLDDLHIRLGRLEAQSLFQNGTPREYSEADRRKYEEHFKKVRVARPALYLEWGAALSLACKCHQKALASGGEVKQPEEVTGVPEGASSARPKHETPPVKVSKLRDAALEQLAKARQINRRWWRLPLAEAELRLDLCRKESPEGEGEPNENLDPLDLDRAQIAFDEAISLNPNSPDAYRDRAELLRLRYRLANLTLALPVGNKGTNKDADKSGEKTANKGGDNGTDTAKEIRQRHLLQQAKQSATTACTMTLNRQPQSLRVLAAIYADMQDYEKAAKFAVRAAEYASDDDRDKLKKTSTDYAKHAGKNGAELASALHQVWVPAAGHVGGEATEAKPPTPELYFIDRSLDAYQP